MSHNIKVFVLIIVVSYVVIEVTSKVDFTNIVCTSYDKEFSDFEYCYLKSVNRTYKYLSFKCNLYQKPVRKVNVNLALHKRFNGYRPFMYNITVDACKFLKDPQKNPILNFFYSWNAPFLNVNHTCPFNHAIILEKLNTESVNHQFSVVLPFPDGDYMVEVNWIAYDINRAVTKFYFTLS
ncbi:uncharacterized protein [Drosophila pseudoobscura]|uniref:MD-2-related lipid-recognition domain-containing protein n=1 Tax=Drosophila pseudoobscura pseudoobscura TaxID=46245 RepID=A0A6I8VE91_DROPS|nr:uncharacterized protein LOC26532949 [Drosophila pseudoobscura]